MKKNILTIILLSTFVLLSGCNNNPQDNKTLDNNSSITVQEIELKSLDSQHDYVLSRRYITEYRGSNKIISDWCLGTQVWREFGYGRRGSMSQIMIVDKGYRTRPLSCKEYGEYKDKI